MGFLFTFSPEFINVRNVFKVVILAMKRNTGTLDGLCVVNAAVLVSMVGFCLPLGLNLLNVQGLFKGILCIKAWVTPYRLCVFFYLLI